MVAAELQSAEQSIYLPELATVARAEPQGVTEMRLCLALDSGRPLGHDPGQFVEVSLFGIGEAPISVSSGPQQAPDFELVVRRCGTVTEALHKLTPGAKLGIRGPFGRGFDVAALHGRDLLFVAGGIGLVPLRSLIHSVLADRGAFGDVTILYGTKTPGERLFLDELAAWQERSDVSFLDTIDRPDPAWSGNVGVITTLFAGLDLDAKQTTAVIVGPPVMYRFAIMECRNAGIADEDIVVSLERRMKCGVGKCGHCQINGRYVCQDGPVFKYSEIKFLKEAL